MKSPALPFFDVPVQVELTRQMAPASLANWDRLLPILPDRRLRVLLALCRLCASQDDATGGELAHFMGWSVLAVRPRLSELFDNGCVIRCPMRASRVDGESTSHGYKSAVPLAAVERAISERQK